MSMESEGRRPVTWTTNGGNFGDHILKPGMGRIYKPLFNGQSVVFRPLAGFAPRSDELDGYRFGPGRGEYGQWLQQLIIAKSVGTDPKGKQSYVLAIPNHESFNTLSTNPLVLLQRNLSSAVNERREPQGTAGLLKGGNNAGAAIPNPSDSALVHAFVMHTGTKTLSPPAGFEADKPMSYMLLSKTACEAFMQIGDTPSQTPNAEDWRQRYLYADPVGISSGQFVVMYKKGHDPRQVQAAASNSWQGSQEEKSSGGFEGYACHFESQFGAVPSDLTQYESFVRGRIQRFSDIVHIPTIEEQLSYLVQAFPQDQHALVYALDDHYGRMLPTEYRQIGLQKLGRTPATQAYPGNSMPIQQAPAWGQAPQHTPAPVGTPGINTWGQPSMPPQVQQPVAPPAQSGGWGAPAVQSAPVGQPTHVSNPPELAGATAGVQPQQGVQPVGVTQTMTQDEALKALELARASFNATTQRPAGS